MARPMTLEELVAAVREASHPTEEGLGFRVEEVCDATGMGSQRVRRMIRQGIQAGTVEVAQRRRKCMDGRFQSVAVYVFLDSTVAPSP